VSDVLDDAVAAGLTDDWPVTTGTREGLAKSRVVYVCGEANAVYILISL
jgi:hypothetical protein